MKYQIDAIARNERLSEEIVRRNPALHAILPTAAVIAPQVESSTDVVRRTAGDPHDEAIVLVAGRPSLPVRNDTFDIPVADFWKARLYPTKSKLDRAIRSVGRIEVPELREPYQGTGWMIAPGIIVTNRHVALRFGQRGTGSTFRFRTSPFGDPLSARIDFREEDIPTRSFEVRITEIRYIAPDDPGNNSVPDIAFVRVEPVDDRPLPQPIPLLVAAPKTDQVVAAIGYPAQDIWNPVEDQMRIFGGRFDVKRLAPGEVMRKLNKSTFTHDCTTLGGSSGSAIIDVETGAAIGLHFSGLYKDANYAVSAATLAETLAGSGKAGEVEAVAAAPAPKAKPERVVKVTSLAGRSGYQADFLGAGAKLVPLPAIDAELDEVIARQPASSGVAVAERHLLHYEHYTVVVRKDRRMAVYTASNIDGASANRIKRTGDPWAFDPRIGKSFQIGNALYTNNDFDRGHLVRRLDPAWGPTAKLAEEDTFFYTNCTPQIHYFNDTLWGDLEDYLLDSADTQDFKASIFTGPVFGDNDPEYRGALIPTAYWKVAVMVRADTGKLTATAYVVSQSDLLTHLEFAYGQFRTYQIPVTRAEAIAKLDFGSLRTHDPFVPEEGIAGRELTGPADIRL
jgi:endonuclease G